MAWSHDMTMLLDDDLLAQFVMPDERLTHLVTMLLPDQGAALDVSEEKGDGAGR